MIAGSLILITLVTGAAIAMVSKVFPNHSNSCLVSVIAGSLILITLVAGAAIAMVSKVSSWRQRISLQAAMYTSKHSILEYMTGNYLSAQYCKVIIISPGLHNFQDFLLICLIWDHINPWPFMYFNPPSTLNLYDLQPKILFNPHMSSWDQ